MEVESLPKFTDMELEVVKNLLFENGKALFIKYGLKKTSIDDIVQACEISKGTFYKFFHSKEELYFEIFKKEEEVYLHIYESAFASTRNDRERMTTLIKELWSYFSTNRFLHSFYEREEQDLLIRKISKEVIQKYTEEQRRKFVHILKAKDSINSVNPEIIVGMIRGVLIMSLSKRSIGEHVYDEVMHNIIQIIGTGLDLNKISHKTIPK